MAKYTITHTCGHTEEHDLCGTHKNRENKIEWLETTLCPECYAAQQIQKNNLVEVEMFYGEYKNNHADCKTKPNSYNNETKTIIVYMPAPVVESETVPAANETSEESEISEIKAARKEIMAIGFDTNNADQFIVLGAEKIEKAMESSISRMTETQIKMYKNSIQILRKHNLVAEITAKNDTAFIKSI